MNLYKTFNKIYNVLYVLSIAFIVLMLALNTNDVFISENKMIIIQIIISAVLVFANILSLISEFVFYFKNGSSHFLDKYEYKLTIYYEATRSLFGIFSVLSYMLDVLNFDKLFIASAIIALISLLLSFFSWYKKRAYLSQSNSKGVL